MNIKEREQLIEDISNRVIKKLHDDKKRENKKLLSKLIDEKNKLTIMLYRGILNDYSRQRLADIDNKINELIREQSLL